MKLFLPLLLTLTLLCGCAPSASPAPAASPAPVDRPSDPPVPAPQSRIFRIVDGAEAGQLLLSDEEGGVFTLGTGGLADCPELTDGMQITVYFNAILETWPGQFQLPGEAQLAALGHGPVEIADAEPDDRSGFYLRVLEDLWEEDAGLNSGPGLKYLGMDLTALTHLDAGEKAAVAWKFAGDHGLELLPGTWEELAGQGYIDRDHLYWEDGIHFSLTTTALSGDITSFRAQKWRSGTGALFLICEGSRTEGTWDYTVTSYAIA